MSKFNSYPGSVELISGIKQKNDGDFPLMESNAIQVDENGKRLDEVLKEIDSFNMSLNNNKINMPKNTNGNITNGTNGQMLQTNGDGTTKWIDVKETDPTVPDWAKQPTKPTYTADEIGALDDTVIASDSDIELYFNTDETITNDNDITATDTEADDYLNMQV